MARLTPRDKLALTLTSAGSQRKLADSIGVSPRALGRYLRGERDIPPELNRSIQSVFSIHKSIALDQARVLNVPVDAARPVFVDRPLIRVEQRGFKVNKKGVRIPTVTKVRIPGQRLFVTGTQFLTPALRQQIAADVLASPAVGAVTARTVGTAAQAIRQRVSGFAQFQAQLAEQKLTPRSKIASYTEYSGKVRPGDGPAAAADMALKAKRNNLVVDTLVFLLPREEAAPSPRKRPTRRSSRRA